MPVDLSSSENLSSEPAAAMTSSEESNFLAAASIVKVKGSDWVVDASTIG